ncbi:MAG: phytanoyl-CoA dioxygenase family protein [Chloroflexota bacterium]
MLDFVPASEKQLNHFDEHGYLVVRNALDSEMVAKLIAVSDRLVDSDIEQNRQRKPDGLYDGYRNCISLDEAYIPLLAHPTIFPLVVQLLGGNLHLITSHLIYKHPDPPGTPPTRREPHWHRDYGIANRDMGNATASRIILKCAYYLTDLSQPNSGVTLVAPGSNRLTEPIEIPDGAVDPVNVAEPLLNPGDCLIFENRTWHAGGSNLTSWIRKTVMFGYGYRWIMPIDYRQQEASMMDKMTRFERFLVGGRWDEGTHYVSNGGTNPLNEWCEAHGVPFTRFSGPGG